MLQTPKCFQRKCQYFLGVSQPDGTELSERVTCTAFPGRIPDDIAYGDNLHTEPHPNQEGDFVYKKKTEE